MKEINRKSLGYLRNLFAEDIPYKSFVESVLQGFQGKAYVDIDTNPSVARLKIGPFNIMGGNSESDAALDIISGAQKDDIFMGNSSWEKKVKVVYKGL